MGLSLSERAAAFEQDQKEGRGPALKPSKGFTENLQAERRVKSWQKELKAKRG